MWAEKLQWKLIGVADFLLLHAGIVMWYCQTLYFMCFMYSWKLGVCEWSVLYFIILFYFTMIYFTILLR